MKTIRSFTRQQIGLLSGAVFMLAMLVIVPWQVVAQDSNPSTKPPVSPGVDESKATENSAKAQGLQSLGLPETKASSAAMEKLLVGTWRGGPSGSDVLTIQKNGTYTWLFRTDGQGFAYWPAPHSGMRGPAAGQVAASPAIGPLGGALPGRPMNAGVPSSGARATYTNNSGKWKLEGDTLVLIYQPMPLVLRGLVEVAPGTGTPQPTDLWPTDFEASGNVYTARISVVRVDDSLLRLMGLVQAFGARNGEMQPTVPKFFKRVDTKSATPEFAAAVPQDVQHIAGLASLNAEEASLMTKWFEDVNKNLSAQHRKELHFELLDRLQSARTGKIDFAELFQLTPDEAKSYRELVKLAGGIGAIGTLAEQGQLTGVELSALKKITKFKTDIDLIGGMIEYELQLLKNPGGLSGMPADFVPAGDDAARSDDVGAVPSYQGSADNQARAEMLYKLQTLFIELDTWLNSTVFN